MNTAFQPQRDMVSGHVPNAFVPLDNGSFSGKSILRGAAMIERAISTTSRYFAATAALDASPLFGDGLHLEHMIIGGSRASELLGLAGLNRLMNTGACR